MQLVDPRVSTASKFLTSTYLSANLFAVIAKDTVIHPNRPSGTLATMIPIAYPTAVSTDACSTTNDKIKNKIPSPTAMQEIRMTNLFNSIFKGVSGVSPPVAKSAI